MGDLDGTSAVVDSRGRWEATVTVTVVDASGDLVENAAVTFDWDNGKGSGTKTCTTPSNGQCSVSETNGKQRSWITFTVGNVTHATLSYDAAGNQDPDGDSNGSSIKVYKP